MTEFKTHNYEPVDYCIELSKMLASQDKDSDKLMRLFKELLAQYGGPDYLTKYINENDHMLGSFCQSVMILAQQRNLHPEHSLRLCHKVHINMPKDDLMLKSTDSEEEIHRKNSVAEDVYQRVVLGNKPAPAPERKRSLWERVVSFFSGH